jgi:hydroxymethylpyrimidine/phosphomethylpyrimidine kinase
VARLAPVVLAVGSTHPLNIAGVGLDARVAAALDIRLVTVIAGVTAQDGSTLLARSAIEEGMIAAQFAALHDVWLDAVHVGALVGAQAAAAVGQGLAGLGPIAIVCDPVVATTGGERLADDATVGALHDRVFRHCALVTPNLAELACFLESPVRDVDDMERGARELLRSSGAAAVLVKGGHLEGAPTDVLVTPQTVTRFTADRLGSTLRGTGDLLACAIAARLAHGDDLARAIAQARDFVRRSIAAGIEFAGARTIP